MIGIGRRRRRRRSVSPHGARGDRRSTRGPGSTRMPGRRWSRSWSSCRATSTTRSCSRSSPSGWTATMRLGRPTQRVFYLAVSPSFFGRSPSRSRRSALGAGAEPPTRLMIEKPFGHDLDSALALNAEVSSAFDESQVFRIDHYLGKETVQNLQVLRFAQRDPGAGLEPPLRRARADHDGRGPRYRPARRLLRLRGGDPRRDPEPPDAAARTGRDGGRRCASTPTRSGTRRSSCCARCGATSRTRCPTTSSGASTAPGGWAARRFPRIVDEEGVPDDSRTETYVAMRVEVDNWRWAGTPFYLRSGKRLPRRVTEIAVRFRPVPHLPFARADIGEVEPNELVLSVQPDEGPRCAWSPRFQGRRCSAAGADGVQVRDVVPGRLAGGLRATAPRRPARRRHPVHPGRRGRGGVEDRPADPRSLERDATGPAVYEAGSQGPPEADELLAVRGRRWRQI